MNAGTELLAHSCLQPSLYHRITPPPLFEENSGSRLRDGAVNKTKLILGNKRIGYVTEPLTIIHVSKELAHKQLIRVIRIMENIRRRIDISTAPTVPDVECDALGDFIFSSPDFFCSSSELMMANENAE
ncbi:unnamed protein product [Linum trigynum]|uniref:Uncharacterized protein n=1 Tax=Linum trigynum TaxID=586398 RepID=A0AAV2EDV1_9ROSI